MGKIFAGLLIAAVGMIMVNLNSEGPGMKQGTTLLWIGFGGLLQFGSIFLVLWGMKTYFLEEIITLLTSINKKLSPASNIAHGSENSDAK